MEVKTMSERKRMIVSEKGEITLPKEIIKALGLQLPGKVCFQLEGLEQEDTLVMKKFVSLILK